MLRWYDYRNGYRNRSAPVCDSQQPQRTPDLPFSLLKPKQNSNVIDSLCSGTHYVRVWDACGGYATQAVTVNSYSNTPSFYQNSYYNFQRYACDSLVANYGIYNIRLRANHPDTAIIRSWISWPDGSTDTIAVSTT